MKKITMHGNPVTVIGRLPDIGHKAPDFTVVDNSLAPKTLKDFRGKTLIISAVPSLDTPVCDMETRKFNELAAGLSGDVQILTISMDLPFAQARWCGNAGIDRVITLSDHASASFGEAYGVLIKGLRLLARAVFIVDSKGILRYVQVVPEITHEPNYDDVLESVKKL